MAVNNEQNQYMYCIYVTVNDQTCESLQNEKMKIQPNHGSNNEQKSNLTNCSQQQQLKHYL